MFLQKNKFCKNFQKIFTKKNFAKKFKKTFTKQIREKYFFLKKVFRKKFLPTLVEVS